MASSSNKLQIVRFYERPYLPALSLLLLTGFSFSITLPSSLLALIPPLESLFLVSLPHLWKAFLSWITPPCLFVLLNGIIMILTATSGSFSRPSPSPVASDLYPNLEKQSSVLAPVAAILDEPSAVNDTPPEIDPPIADSQLGGPTTVSQLGNISSITSIGICLHPVEELSEELSNGGAGNEHMEMHMAGKEDMEMHMIREEVPEPTTEIIDGREIVDDDPSSSLCEEVVKGGSVPSSSLFSSSPALKNNIRRSFSIDSASLVENEAIASEYLSEDAFKKRIEDFIFKVNSKIRSETRLL